MTGMASMVKRILLLSILVISVPLIIVITSGKKGEDKDHLYDANKPQSYSILQQPKDTEVVDLPIPIHHWTTENGIQTFFVPREETPFIDIRITLDSGSSRDGDKPGLAMLVAKALNKGTTDFDSAQIDTKLSEARTFFASKVDRDKISISFRLPNTFKANTTPTNSKKPNTSTTSTPTIPYSPNRIMLDLFTSMITEPSFSTNEIEELKKQALKELQKNTKSPKIIAMQSFFDSIYDNHPYAHSPFGTEKSISEIKQEDLKSFHQRYFVAQNVTITIVGSIPRDYAKEMANRISEKFALGNAAEPLPALPEQNKNRLIVIPSNATDPQTDSQIVQGMPLSFYGDPDYFALWIGNFLLGGKGKDSELSKAIHNTFHIDLDISSNMINFREKGPFIINLEAKKSDVKRIISTIKSTVKNFNSTLLGDETLLIAKQIMLKDLATKIDSSARIAETVSTIAFYHLPYDFLKTYESHVDKLTPTDIQIVFQRRMDPDKMTVVVLE